MNYIIAIAQYSKKLIVIGCNFVKNMIPSIITSPIIVVKILSLQFRRLTSACTGLTEMLSAPFQDAYSR